MPDKLDTYQDIPADLPFFGLGFSLESVVVRARLMLTSRVGSASRTQARPAPAIARHAGYGLMLWLSRETGGS